MFTEDELTSLKIETDDEWKNLLDMGKELKRREEQSNRKQEGFHDLILKEEKNGKGKEG